MTTEELEQEANKTPMPTLLKWYALQKEKGEITADTICKASQEFSDAKNRELKEEIEKLKEKDEEWKKQWHILYNTYSEKCKLCLALEAKTDNYEEVIISVLELKELWLYGENIKAENEGEALALNTMKLNLIEVLNLHSK